MSIPATGTLKPVPTKPSKPKSSRLAKPDGTVSSTSKYKKLAATCVMATPFIMLLFSLISSGLVYFYGATTYRSIHNLFGLTVGGSLITSLFFLFYALHHNFCVYSKVSIGTLILLNVLNILHLIFDLGGNFFIFDAVLAGLGLIFSFIFLIKDAIRK